MPAVMHLIAHYLLGAWAAWSARRTHAFTEHLWAWPLALVAALTAVLVVPCTTFQFRFYPDHALAYAFAPQLYPSIARGIGPLSLLTACGYVVALVLGYAITRWGLVGQSAKKVGLPLVAMGLAALWVQVTVGARAWLFGNDSAYWAGEAASFLQTPSACITVLAYVACAYGVHKLTRRFSQRPFELG